MSFTIITASTLAQLGWHGWWVPFGFGIGWMLITIAGAYLVYNWIWR